MLSAHGHVFVVFSIPSPFRAYAAVVFTALTLGRASSVAPDINKARASACQIFALIRRNPEIDSYRNDGLQPVRGLITI